MESGRLREELQRFDGRSGAAAAHTPPASWYLEPAFHALERDAVFDRNWIAVARTDEVATAGSALGGSLLERPWLLVRGEDGRLRAFHGACRHHAAELLSGCARLQRIVCPYHGWTYALDGTLVAAPHIAGAVGFERAELGLRPIALDTWGGWVFLHFGRAPRALAADMPAAGPGFDTGPEAGWVHVGQRRSRLACNWKVFVDNYLDGGYHVAAVHPELAAGLDLASYRTEVGARWVLQTSAARGGRLGSEAHYAWVHPNLMLNRYGQVLDTNRVLPLAPASTEVVFDFFVRPGMAADADAVARCIAASERVQAEDVAISEAVQRGLHSPGYQRGRYAPALEGGAYRFHQLLAEELHAALPARDRY